MKSWVAPIMSSPLFGVSRFSVVFMRVLASLLASSVWGRWRFISSPSKSAL
jgi:hypothetical protein